MKRVFSVVLLSMYLLTQVACIFSRGSATMVTASYLGGAGLLAGPVCPTCAGVGLVLLAVEVVASLAQANLGELSVASSNPDSNFSSPAVVVPVQFLLTGDHILDASLLAGGKVIDDSRMVNLSLRKYYGALSANNIAAEQLQLSTASSAMSRLNADLQTYSIALSGVSAEVQGTPFASIITAQPSDVLSLAGQIVLTGSFPMNETGLFAQANATPTELSEAIALVATVTLGSITDAGGLQGATIFSTAAQEINGVNASVYLPPGISLPPPVQSVPALSPRGTVVLIFLLASMGFLLLRRTRPA